MPSPKVRGGECSKRRQREVEPQHQVYGSDLGQIHNPSHAVVTRWFVKLLLAYGATKDEIGLAFKENTWGSGRWGAGG